MGFIFFVLFTSLEWSDRLWSKPKKIFNSANNLLVRRLLLLTTNGHHTHIRELLTSTTQEMRSQEKPVTQARCTTEIHESDEKKNLRREPSQRANFSVQLLALAVCDCERKFFVCVWLCALEVVGVARLFLFRRCGSIGGFYLVHRTEILIHTTLGV